MSTGEDELALRRLADTYARTMDDRDTATLLSLFVPDGRLTITAKTTREYRNPDGLAQIIAYMARYDETMYFVGNHICTVDGEHATGETYTVAYHWQHARDQRTGVVIETPVRYLDEYVRIDDRWRFKQRAAQILWTERRELAD